MSEDEYQRFVVQYDAAISEHERLIREGEEGRAKHGTSSGEPGGDSVEAGEGASSTIDAPAPA